MIEFANEDEKRAHMHAVLDAMIDEKALIVYGHPRKPGTRISLSSLIENPACAQIAPEVHRVTRWECRESLGLLVVGESWYIGPDEVTPNTNYWKPMETYSHVVGESDE